MASRKTKAGSTNSPDKKLPLNKSIPLGIQHVLAMFAGNITVPIIVAGVFGQTPEQKIFLIQMALFVAGVATIIQTVGYKEIGARLPIVQGTSFAFIPIMLPFKAAGLGAVFTAAFIGGIFQIFIGKVLKPIRHLFPPLVTGIVVLMIGFSLLKVGSFAVQSVAGAPADEAIGTGTVQPVPVRLGAAVGGAVAIEGDLSVGSLVVIRGNERLRPGMPVRFPAPAEASR